MVFSSAELWCSVIAELQLQRAKLDLPFVPYTGECVVCLGPAPTTWSPSLCAGTDVYRQFGLGHPLVVQLLEQLPNSEKCSGYHFTYHHPKKLSSWQATVSSFMACPSHCVLLHFPTLPGPLILPSSASFPLLPTSPLFLSSFPPLLHSPSFPPPLSSSHPSLLCFIPSSSPLPAPFSPSESSIQPQWQC